MDNKASNILKMAMITMDIKYQLVTPSNHRSNNAEMSIQTFKKNFISGICSVDKDFNLQLWDILLQQVTISINLLRQSRIHPYLSAHMHIFGELDYNRILLSPPGTRVVIHNSPNDIVSWEPHGESGWYIGPAMEH